MGEEWDWRCLRRGKGRKTRVVKTHRNNLINPSLDPPLSTLTVFAELPNHLCTLTLEIATSLWHNDGRRNFGLAQSADKLVQQPAKKMSLM